MGWKPAPEFVVIFFVEVSIVDVQVSKAGLELFGQIVIEIRDAWSKQIGTVSLYLVAEHITDDPIEFAIVNSSPERILRARVEMAEKQVEIAFEMICKNQEPKLISGSDVKDAFESQGTGRGVDLAGRSEMDGAPGCFAIKVEGHQESNIG